MELNRCLGVMTKRKLSNKKSNRPLISIITPSLNQGEFIEDSIKSMLSQSFKNWEHIVMDGLSTDNTLEVLKKYKHVRVYSGKDKGYWDALTKGVKKARGKYIMICMASDGYLNKRWFEKCVDILENDKEVSLVWGFPRRLEGKKLTQSPYPHFHRSGPPQKFDWFPYWLMTGEALPNEDFCIRKTVFEQCNTISDKTPKGYELFEFNYNFNVNGYVPFNIHEIAEFSREHEGRIGRRWGKLLADAAKKYDQNIKKHRTKLLSNKIQHKYRNSDGKIINKEVNLTGVSEFKSRYLKTRNLIYITVQRGPSKLRKKITSFV